MHGVMKNIAHLCSRDRSRTWGPEGWKKVTVCIVSDGRLKINPRTLSLLAALGVYQDGVAKNIVGDKPVTAHIYEVIFYRKTSVFAAIHALFVSTQLNYLLILS